MEKPKNHFPPGFDPMLPPGTYYVPNAFPLRERVISTLVAAFLLAYGALGLYINDLFVPGKHTDGLHLHGLAAWLMYGAMLSAASVLISVVVDHYDRRKNENSYVKYRKTAKFIGWAFFAASLGFHIWKAI